MTRESHLFASPHPAFADRRQFLRRTGSGFGMLALAALLDAQDVLSKAGLAAPGRSDRGRDARPRQQVLPVEQGGQREHAETRAGALQELAAVGEGRMRRGEEVRFACHGRGTVQESREGRQADNPRASA